VVYIVLLVLGAGSIGRLHDGRLPAARRAVSPANAHCQGVLGPGGVRWCGRRARSLGFDGVVLSVGAKGESSSRSSRAGRLRRVLAAAGGWFLDTREPAGPMTPNSVLDCRIAGCRPFQDPAITVPLDNDGEALLRQLDGHDA
jgi:hypothetical protein